MLLTLLYACGADPVARDVEAYAAAMASPLQKNQALAQRFLDIASAVKKGETDGVKISDTLTKELVPSADALTLEVTAIQPATPKLRDTHGVIVKAWSDRAAAYHEMSDAWAANNLAGFDAAHKKNLQTKLEEERYFTAVNGFAGAYGVVIAQYP